MIINFCFLNKDYLLVTINACITPGIKNIRVSIRLIRKSLPKPLASPTPNGGIKMFKMIVKIDIVFVFDSILNYYPNIDNIIKI
ncbi:hypothetical protein AAT17_11100 [Nonlabens sp. MIC269]|nr:hypothetical protein AAT17_11100 [Nonlabens sp. MIC269]